MAKKKLATKFDLKLFPEEEIKPFIKEKRLKAKTEKSGEIKFSSNDEMKPHSEAKVTLYKQYLEKYLAILGVVKFITKVNIFDIFCGTGVYKNGKEGSPIAAFNAIRKVQEFLPTINYVSKPTTLTINDGNPNSIKVVSDILKNLNQKNPCCDLYFHQSDAAEMINYIINKLSKQSNTERNLIFIDPTGYKEIYRSDLQRLLITRQSEVILFLPVSFMHRFRNVVQSSFQKPAYQPLKRFLSDFFNESHPIRCNSEMEIYEFINYIREVLKFDEFFCTSFYLQRGANNYYALFFITPSILGLDRIIETKWKLDEDRGQGFIYEEKKKKLQEVQLNIFSVKKPSEFERRMDFLEQEMYNFIKSHPNCDNRELYEFILNKDFRPTHAIQILKKWQKLKTIQLWDLEKGKEARGYNLKYDSYKLKKATVTYKILN